MNALDHLEAEKDLEWVGNASELGAVRRRSLFRYFCLTFKGSALMSVRTLGVCSGWLCSSQRCPWDSHDDIWSRRLFSAQVRQSNTIRELYLLDLTAVWQDVWARVYRSSPLSALQLAKSKQPSLPKESLPITISTATTRTRCIRR